MECIYAFEKLVTVMKQLRRKEGGCPWDSVQTHESLKRHLIEECYEVLDAIERKDSENLKEELGDVLLQIIFHAMIAEEEESFTLTDVIQTETEKMLKRHPHVFENANYEDDNWEKSKHKENILDGIPKALPALIRAQKLQEKARNVGFDWDDKSGAWEKIYEELEEVKAANNLEHRAEEIGDVFFALVNLCRFENVVAEEVATMANNKFTRRFNYVEKRVKQSGKSWEEFLLCELDDFWNQAKLLEKNGVIYE